ncbi:Cyclin-B1-2 [Platanthera guangdongensis]|uniref:Cyclin-B1-2 n=1 Tax=Platanthera guangdongensis TaxID=2320717 RepID=A0ABR2MKH0_9ASPA
MAVKSISHDVSSNIDALRFGLEGVKGDIVGSHPLESLREMVIRRFQRPLGMLPSSIVGYEALTGSLEDFGFEDYLNMPQDAESFIPPDMQHAMEVCLGLSGGPVCPRFI